MSTFKARNDFITNVRQRVTAFLEARHELESLRWEWDKRMNTELVDASGSDPEVEEYEAHDFLGHEGLMKADVTAVFTSMDAIDVTLDAGHGTNLEKVRM